MLTSKTLNCQWMTTFALFILALSNLLSFTVTSKVSISPAPLAVLPAKAIVEPSLKMAEHTDTTEHNTRWILVQKSHCHRNVYQSPCKKQTMYPESNGQEGRKDIK